MKVERWICDVCFACDHEPWHGKQYFTEKDEIAHVVSSHKWIQKCVERPDGSQIVLRYLRDLAEYHEALLVGNNANGVRFLEVAELMRVSPFKGPGWYFFHNPDSENPESIWKLAHIEEMRDYANKTVEQIELAIERARIARSEIFDWVAKQNEPVPMPPEWPVSEQEEREALPVLP